MYFWTATEALNWHKSLGVGGITYSRSKDIVLGKYEIEIQGRMGRRPVKDTASTRLNVKLLDAANGTMDRLTDNVNNVELFWEIFSHLFLTVLVSSGKQSMWR